MAFGAWCAEAQQLPTPEQAKILLETRPDLVARLRREIASSGLSADQIRARLRAAGYPEDILDPYLDARGSGRESPQAGAANDRTLDAVSALGITDSADTAELRRTLRARRSSGTDTAEVIRSLRSRVDSLYQSDALDQSDLPSLDNAAPDRQLISPRRRSRATSASGFEIFGLSVFSGGTTQFDPNLAGPVDANYRLGPGDRIVLILTGDAERSFALDVTREGFVVIPGVGELPVANLTLGQLEDMLYTRLGRVYSGLRRGAGATTHFSLNLARLHSNQVFVLGDVDQPGSYRVSSAGTALTALYAAGGPTSNGSLRRVEIRRGGRLVDSLDLYDYFLRADGSHDARLQSGDVVFVPVHGARARVIGEVVRPATYELKRGESLSDVLSAAGGFTAQAARRRVQISRILPPTQRDTTDRARVVIDIASEQFASGTGPAYPIETGDVIRVFAVSDRISRRVAVQGHVWTPGDVGFTPGMRLSDAIRLSGGVKPDLYLDELLISRLRGSDSTRVQLRTAFADSSGRLVNDMLLRDDDEIRIFAVSELRASEYVAITGAVRKPVRVPYREGITLRDLVLLAGGLDERALIGEAEIARLPQTREGGHLAESRRVPMDSSYALARANGGQVVQAGGVASSRAHTTPDVVLMPHDNVLILAQPDWALPRHVTVTGEVRYPGTYSLANKQDRISDLIERAGGLTKTSYPEGIVFFRRQDNLGRVGVDLTRVLNDNRYRDNLVLQDGDSVHLPQYSGIVQVQGAVNAARGVAYVPGKDIMFYVSAAGGPSRTAQTERSFVTQPDGVVESVRERMLRPDAVPEPKPGSVVMVPEKDQTERNDGLARLGVITQLVGGLVTIVAILKR